MEKGIPNLDDCTEADRKEYEDILASLVMYCSTKSRASKYRLEGKITLAVKLEKQCDVIYFLLPEWAKW